MRALSRWAVHAAAHETKRETHQGGQSGDSTSLKVPHTGFPPVDELLDHFHAGVELVESQDVLLSEETQPRAFPKVLQTDSQSHQTGSSGPVCLPDWWEAANYHASTKRFNVSHHVVFEDSLDHGSEDFNHYHGPRPLPTVLQHTGNTHTHGKHTDASKVV